MIRKLWEVGTEGELPYEAEMVADDGKHGYYHAFKLGGELHRILVGDLFGVPDRMYRREIDDYERPGFRLSVDTAPLGWSISSGS